MTEIKYGYNGYRIMLKDDSIIEHLYKRPVGLNTMCRRVVNFIRRNNLKEDVSGYELLNTDPEDEIRMFREETPYGEHWNMELGRKEEE